MVKPHSSARSGLSGRHADRYRPFDTPQPADDRELARCGACQRLATVTDTGRLHAHEDSRGNDCPNDLGPGDRQPDPDTLAAGLAILNDQAADLAAAYRRPDSDRTR